MKWRNDNRTLLNLAKNEENYQENIENLDETFDNEFLDIHGISYFEKLPALKTIKLATIFDYEILLKTKDVQGK